MNLIDILKNFAHQENTDFAILINGSWGSGKTFFLKKVVSEEIKKVNCKLTDKKTEPYELVYVSLYGLTSAEELQKRLFLEINPLLKSKVFKIAGGAISKIADFFNASFSSKDEETVLNIFGGIPKNKILVFDDLERLATETINEVLGFINTYTEHQNLKVIIVADEEKIKAKIVDYDNVKEKLIRFTYLYKPELSEVFPSFVARYSSQSYKQFLTDNSKIICDLFEKGEHKNLRSLRFVLDLFESVFESVTGFAEISPETKATLLKRFLFFVTTYSIEYKKDGDDKNLAALKKIGTHLGSSSLGFLVLRNLRNQAFGKDDQKEAQLPETEKFINAFEDKYLEDDSDFEYYDFIASYIHSGDLDINAIKDDCIKSHKILEEQKVKPEQVALTKLKNCLTLNDSDFLPLVDEIYGHVDSGVYKLEEFPIIFQNLLNCSIGGIANLKVDDTAVDRFKEGMKKSLQHSQYRNDMEGYVSTWHQTEEILQRVRDYAVELNKTLESDTDKKLAEHVFSLMNSGKLDEFNSIMTSSEVQSIPIYQVAYLNPDSFVDKYKALSNNEKLTVNEIFYHFGLRFDPNRQSMKKELLFYQEVLTRIDKIIEAADGNKQISTNLYVQFKYWLEQTIKRIREIY